MFVLSFKNGNDGYKKPSLGKYCMQIQEILILDYYALLDVFYMLDFIF